MQEIHLSFRLKDSRPSANEKDQLRALVKEIKKKKIGEIVDEGFGGGVFDLFIQLAHAAPAVKSIHKILKTLQIESQVTVDVNDLSTDDETAAPAPVSEASPPSQSSESAVHSYEAALQKMVLPEAKLTSLANKVKKDRKKWTTSFIEGALWIPLKIAKDYHGRFHTWDLMDLIEEANIGLIQAADHLPELKSETIVDFVAVWVKKSLDHATSQTS